MATGKNKYRVLVVSTGDKIYDFIVDLLPAGEYQPVLRARDAGEARRMLVSAVVDIVIINTPLSDDFGMELAADLADSSISILLLVKNELVEQIAYKAVDMGILTLGKPNTSGALFGAIRLLTAMSVRLRKMEKKNKTLQEKMSDIRIVNRAKWLLIEHHHMTEKDAHYYIEKQAMDTRLSRKEVAESIIRTYDA